VQVSSGTVRDANEIESAIEAIGRTPNAGLIVTPGIPINDRRKLIFALASRYRSWPIQAGHEAVADWIAASGDHNRDRRGPDSLHQFIGRDETGENDHANFALRQIAEFGGLAIIPTIREAVFDSNIAAFGIANVSKPTTE